MNIHCDELEGTSITILYRKKSVREHSIIYYNFYIYSHTKMLDYSEIKVGSIRIYGNILVLKQWEFKGSENNEILFIDTRSGKKVCKLHGDGMYMNYHVVHNKDRQVVLIKLGDTLDILSANHTIITYGHKIALSGSHSKYGELLIETDTGRLLYKPI